MPDTAVRPVRRRLRAPQRDILYVVVLCAFFYFLSGHDDLLETSNHAWLLLGCIRDGQFFHFYEVVMAHQNALYYVNNAHYNILCYLLYALWQLPVFLAAQIGHFAVSESFLLFWSKAVGTAAFGACAVLLKKLALTLGFSDPDAHLAALYFVLDPFAFFAALIMGQYDSLCLVFVLASLLAWRQKRMWQFSLWTGAAMVFKFFPLLLFLPLLVLVEKRPLRCLAYTAGAFWLALPTALLFRGRTGDMDVFNGLMIDRVFAVKLPGGILDVPAYLLLYALLLAACYLYRPGGEEALARWMPWLGLAVYGGLFLFVSWHPQWLILAVPFAVLTTFQQRQRMPWLYLEGVWFFGFWAVINKLFPAQLESNLLACGWLGALTRRFVSAGPHNSLDFYLALIPRLYDLAPVIFAAPLAAAILLKCPIGGRSPGDRLAGSSASLARAPSERAVLYGVFFACIVCLWLGTALYVLVKSFGV
jgi:hypothetical protein